ncbi:uncharacterized protein [Henckelia pumila]|uniref:uncharacterized protein n=1 Tax=Henckelia pumila TaxID=405737 RepID=UPI003C6DC697
MGERTALDCLINFCRCVIDVFGARYLRRPNDADTQRLLQMHEDKHGFPEMLGSLDCMHWEWRNCPVAWKGQYTRGSHGIYPEWAAFVKSFPCPEDPKRKKLKERQESARKDVERAFGVLQARWTIIRGPARSYYKNDLKNIMYTCIILHNMIIEDE